MLSLISCANSPSNDIAKSDSIKRAKSDSIQTAKSDSIKFHSADSLRIAKYRIINEKSPDLIHFSHTYIEWKQGEVRKAREELLKITSQQISDSTLTVEIVGVSGLGEYEGNVGVDGHNITLYYWWKHPALALRKYKLTYKIRIADSKNYTVKVENLGVIHSD
jgi:hypothetical protein